MRVHPEMDGAFTIEGVSSGNYKLFAWDNLAATADENPEFVAGFEGNGLAVQVKSGTSVTTQPLTILSPKR
jgi:hypothetical protein